MRCVLLKSIKKRVVATLQLDPFFLLFLYRCITLEYRERLGLSAKSRMRQPVQIFNRSQHGVMIRFLRERHRIDHRSDENGRNPVVGAPIILIPG